MLPQAQLLLKTMCLLSLQWLSAGVHDRHHNRIHAALPQTGTHPKTLPRYCPPTPPPLPPALLVCIASSFVCLCRPSSQIRGGEGSHSFSCLPHGNTHLCFPLVLLFLSLSLSSLLRTQLPLVGEPLSLLISLSQLPGYLQLGMLFSQQAGI